MALHQEYSLVISALTNLEELKKDVDFIQIVPLENGLGFFPFTKNFRTHFFEKYVDTKYCERGYTAISLTSIDEYFFLVEYCHSSPLVFYEINNHVLDSFTSGHDVAWLFDGKLATRYYIHGDIGGTLDIAMIAAGFYPAGTKNLLRKFGFDKIQKPEEFIRP